MEKLFLILGFLAALSLYSFRTRDVVITFNDSIHATESFPACPPSLAKGSTETAWVHSLQNLLHKKGLLNANTANQGYFGPYTTAAVKTFQNNQGLSVTGTVGAETWAALGQCHQKPQQLAHLACPMVLRKGHQTTWVRTLQRTLKTKGFLIKKYTADGIFGPNTEAAVKAFQKSQNLKSDGVVKSDTWERLGVCHDYGVR